MQNARPARCLTGAKIAATRKRHLACLRACRDARRELVAQHYAEVVQAGGPARGAWTRLAKSLGVGKATISRDLADIRRAAREAAIA
jgi:hypothetical protein